MWARNFAASGQQPESNLKRAVEHARQELTKKKEAETYRNFKYEVKSMPRLGPELTQERKEQALHEIRKDERKQQDKHDTKLYKLFKGEVNAMPRPTRNTD